MNNKIEEDLQLKKEWNALRLVMPNRIKQIDKEIDDWYNDLKIRYKQSDDKFKIIADDFNKIASVKLKEF